jgi:general secretion pathway protein F
MRFEVRAINPRQQVQTLHVEALDDVEVRLQLAARQLHALSIRSSSSTVPGQGWFNRSSKLDVLLFAQELQTLVGAGLSIVETMEALMERAPSEGVRLVLARLLEGLREGKRLSQAMAAQPSVFPPLLTGVIQAAEDTSDLPNTLQRYIGYETQLQALRHRISSAAIYPTILMTVGGGVALFLLGYVVPRFSAVYQGTGRPLPLVSQWLLAWGQWVASHQLVLLVVITALATWAVIRIRGIVQSGAWWRLIQWVPGAKPRLRVLELSRLYLTLGMLIEGGIPINRAMQLAAAVLPPSQHASWDAARHAVSQGFSLTNALEQHGFAAPVSSRLLRVGERSGQMGMMLGKAAEFYNSETTRWIERFTKTFEPVLMAVIGVVIGVIVVLLYMPIFDLAGSLQ